MTINPVIDFRTALLAYPDENQQTAVSKKEDGFVNAFQLRKGIGETAITIEQIQTEIRDVEITMAQNKKTIEENEINMEEIEELIEENDKFLQKWEIELRKLKGIYGLVSEISFCTPVVYRDEVSSWSAEGLRQWVDAYFCVRSCQVAMVETLKYPDNVLLKDGKKQLWWITLLKIVSYFTLILPILMLTAKYLLRHGHPFFIQQEKWISLPSAEGISISAADLQYVEKNRKIRQRFVLEMQAKHPLE